VFLNTAWKGSVVLDGKELKCRIEWSSGITWKGARDIEWKELHLAERSWGKGENEFGYRAIRNPGVVWKGAVEKTGRDLGNTCQAAAKPLEGLRLMDECTVDNNLCHSDLHVFTWKKTSND
jgi:hypothetical protein